MIFGGVIAFIFGIMSDKVGRRPIFAISWIFAVTGIFISLISSDLFGVTIGNLFAWAGMDLFFGLVFVYINEMIGG